MAIHERDLFDTSTDQPAWPDPHDDDPFTAGCLECDAARAILAVQVELRLAVRDLWISGWAPIALADEVGRRSASIDARDVIVHALVDEDAARSEQARTNEWTRAVTFLATASGVEEVGPGWIGRWLLRSEHPRAATDVLLDVLDILRDMRKVS